MVMGLAGRENGGKAGNCRGKEERFNCSKFALKNTVSRTVEDFGKASNLFRKGHGKLERFPLCSIILPWLCNAIF